MARSEVAADELGGRCSCRGARLAQGQSLKANLCKFCRPVATVVSDSSRLMLDGVFLLARHEGGVGARPRQDLRPALGGKDGFAPLLKQRVNSWQEARGGVVGSPKHDELLWGVSMAAGNWLGFLW